MELEIVGARILNVLFYREAYAVGYIRLVISFEDSFVEVTVDRNTDELIIQAIGGDDLDNSLDFIRTEDDFTSTILQRTVGKTVGTYWLATNNNGYSDLFALGVDEVVPSLIISCLASRLEIRWASGGEVVEGLNG